MNKKIIASVVVFGAVLSGEPLLAQSFDGSFSKRVYFAIGGGQSLLDPDTNAVAGLEVSDDTDLAGHVTLGFDFSRRLTAELQYADLGTAGLSDGDGIEYTVGSLSGLIYLWNGLGSSEFLDYDGLDQRAGLSLYGRLGVGVVENEAQGTVQFESTDDPRLVAGLGLEYSLASGLGVRAELINFDSDASYGGLSLLYRFGSGPRGKSIPDNSLPKLPEPEVVAPPPPPVAELPPVQAVVAADSDSDGVVDEIDDCPGTIAGTMVDSSGCSVFADMLEGINFLVGSDTLTDPSLVILDIVVSTLLEHEDERISVHAHTDSQGSEDANQLLSRNRAIAVVRYLTSQGIPIERLEARSFGESRPVADNNTRAGRLLNRRVDFVVISER